MTRVCKNSLRKKWYCCSSGKNFCSKKMATQFFFFYSVFKYLVMFIKLKLNTIVHTMDTYELTVRVNLSLVIMKTNTVSTPFVPSLSKGGDIGIMTTSAQIRQFMSGSPLTRSQITCFRCGEQGHYKSECFHWKTRQCWHYQNSKCTEPNCSFAHGEDLRTPWLPRCIRILKREGQVITLGCKRIGHTFKYCPERINN